jgi:hypothetical protein
MNNFKVFTTINKPQTKEKEEIVNFLHQHLDEYGDTKSDI